MTYPELIDTVLSLMPGTVVTMIKTVTLVLCWRMLSCIHFRPFWPFTSLYNLYLFVLTKKMVVYFYLLVYLQFDGFFDKLLKCFQKDLGMAVIYSKKHHKPNQSPSGILSSFFLANSSLFLCLFAFSKNCLLLLYRLS